MLRPTHLVLLALLSVTPAGAAQPSQPLRPAPLSPSEIGTLQPLAQRLRPAVLRVEECAPKACRPTDAVGTAFFIGQDGLALTAYHVVFGAGQLSVRTSGGQVYPVTVVGYDDVQDLALLKVSGVSRVASLPLARALPQPGEAVFTVGNGGTSFLRPQLGRVTALGAQSAEADLGAGTLETNLTVFPGDSGGPLLNGQGQVVGVLNHVAWSGGDNDTDGEYRAYAIPLLQGDTRLADLRRGIKRDAPVAGLGLTGDLALLKNLPASKFPQASRDLGLNFGNTPGAFFNIVTPGGPAARAGLQPLRYDASGQRLQGDLITAVGGKRVSNFDEFQRVLRLSRPGDTIKLTILRGHQTLTVPVKLTGRSQLQPVSELNPKP